MEIRKISNLDTDELQAGELRIRTKAKPNCAKMSCWALCLWSRGFRQKILTWHESTWPHSISWSSAESNRLRVSHFLSSSFGPSSVLVPELHFQKSPLTITLPTETYEGIEANFAEQSWTLSQTVLSVSICSHTKTNNTPCFFADRPTSQGN